MTGQRFIRLVCWITVLSMAQAAAQAQESRPAIPDADRQREIRTQLDETLGIAKAKSKAEKGQVAAKLLEMANDPGVAPDELYVLLQTAIPLTRESSDFTSHQTAVQKLTETFSAESIQEQSQLLVAFISSCKSTEPLKPAVEVLAELAADEGRANRYTQAVQWLTAADKVAKKLRARSSIELIASTKSGLSDRQSAFEAQLKAQETLTTLPEDGKANLVMGQWLAIFCDDWNAAIPLLAKCSDTKWKAAATAEQTASADAESQLKVADAWFDVAQSAGPAQSIVQQRSMEYYDAVEPNLTSPIAKTRVTKRRDELAALLNATPSTVLVAREPTTNSQGAPDPNELPIDQAIELLPWVKLPEHVIQGNWTRNDQGTVVCEASKDSRFMVPVVVSGNYQLTLTFTRRMGQEGAILYLPVGSGACQAFTDGYGGKIAGLQMVDGRWAIDIVGTPSAVSQPEPFADGIPHKFEVTVTQKRSDVDIRGSMDGKPQFSWQGQASQLSIPLHQLNPNPHAIGLVTFQSILDIHSLQLRLNKGGRGYRLQDDWKNPLIEVADKPPTEILKKCWTWNGKKYFISEQPSTLPEAQQLASQWKGRLLTISSAEEEAMIFQEGRDRKLWMSGWCTTDRKWRDERNRPLSYFGKWSILDGVQQPDNHEKVENQLVIYTTGSFGWNDVPMGVEGYHACVEWGEEYPEIP